MKRRYSGWEKVFQRGDATLFIKGIETLRPGDKVVLCLRKSVRDTNDSLKRQEARLRKVAAEYGLTVVFVHAVEGPGWNPSWIDPAIDAARRYGAAALLAGCVNRYARHRWFNPTVKWMSQLQATIHQLRDLEDWANGIPLVTHLSPDATPNQENGYQTKQRLKHKRGGRPGNPGFKVRIREKRKPIAIEKRRLGWSIREIAEFVNRPSSTVERWVKDQPKGLSRFSDSPEQLKLGSPCNLRENFKSKPEVCHR